MPPHVETICVDIGNSGLRCVRLSEKSAGRSTTSNELSQPWDSSVLRIDWPPAAGNLRSPQNDDAELAQSEIGSALTRWLNGAEHAPALACPRQWFVSSVQRATESHFRSCVARFGANQYQLVTHADLDLQVDVDFPDRVGIDRLLAAHAALEHCQVRPMVVIQAGSAITVDWIESPRRFCGGAIMPGVPMMLRLLTQAADMLPPVAADELLELPCLPGRNTAAAMSAGASSAVVGGVQHLVARYRSQFGAQTPVVLSGGDGPRLAPHLFAPIITVDHLVLRGLAAYALSRQDQSLSK